MAPGVHAERQPPQYSFFSKHVMLLSWQHMVLRQSSPTAEQLPAGGAGALAPGVGAALGVGAVPSTVHVHGVWYSTGSLGSMAPGVHAERQPPQYSFFSKHVMLLSWQHMVLRQSSPSAEQLPPGGAGALAPGVGVGEGSGDIIPQVTFMPSRLWSTCCMHSPGVPPSHARLPGPFAQASLLSPTL